MQLPATATAQSARGPCIDGKTCQESSVSLSPSPSKQLHATGLAVPMTVNTLQTTRSNAKLTWTEARILHHSFTSSLTLQNSEATSLQVNHYKTCTGVKLRTYLKQSCAGSCRSHSQMCLVLCRGGRFLKTIKKLNCRTPSSVKASNTLLNMQSLSCAC